MRNCYLNRFIHLIVSFEIVFLTVNKNTNRLILISVQLKMMTKLYQLFFHLYEFNEYILSDV